MAKRGCVSDLTSALVPGSAGALTSPLSTFGVIWLAPKVASQLPADCAEAAEAAVIAATSASSFTALLKRLFILSPDSLCAGRQASGSTEGAPRHSLAAAQRDRITASP